jgi:hypothetical protein
MGRNNSRLKLHNFYTSTTKSLKIEWQWHVERMGNSSAYKISVKCQEDGKKKLGRPRRKWEDKIIKL